MKATINLDVLTQALHALDVAQKTVAATDFMQVSRARIELAFYLKPILAAQKIEVLAESDAEFAALRCAAPCTPKEQPHEHTNPAP